MATDVEKLLQGIRLLSTDQKLYLQRALSREMADMTAAEHDTDSADLRYQQELLRAGLISEPKPRYPDQAASKSYCPVAISGKPLSETIIEERR
jgi:hypothetical protein